MTTAARLLTFDPEVTVQRSRRMAAGAVRGASVMPALPGRPRWAARWTS